LILILGKFIEANLHLLLLFLQLTKLTLKLVQHLVSISQPLSLQIQRL